MTGILFSVKALIKHWACLSTEILTMSFLKEVLEDSSMTGIEFLKEVSNLHPETIRLYVSSKTPFNEDYYYFHAFITKSELSCNTLLEVMNCMSEDTSSIIYS